MTRLEFAQMHAALADRSFVICTIAVRNVGTCELCIPREKYNPWAVLEALQRTQ